MNTPNNTGMASPLGYPMHRQGPSTARSAAMRMPEMVRFWSPNNARQASARKIPAVQPVQQRFHTLRPSQQPPPMIPSSVAMPFGPPVPTGGPMPLTKQAEQQTPVGPHQPHAQIMWRSMTPSTFVYSCYRPRQAAVRPASTGPRLAPSTTIDVDGQPTQPQPKHQSQPNNTNPGLWPGSWARLADRTNQFIIPHQSLCPPVLLTQRRGPLPCTSDIGVSPSIQTRFRKDSRDPFTLRPAVVGTDNCALPHRKQCARGNSPGLQCWRPHSVPPQGHAEFRRAGVPNSLQSSIPSRTNPGVRAPHPSVAQKTQKLLAGANFNRSASTPPAPGRPIPSLASRFWSFFSGSVGQTGDCEREVMQKRTHDARISSSDDLHRGRLPVPTVSWAPTTGDLRHQVQQGRDSSQQLIHKPQAVNLPGSRPPSPNMNLRQGACCQPSVRVPQADATGSFVPHQDLIAQDRSLHASVVQEENKRNSLHGEGSVKMQLPLQREQGVQHSRQRVQLPTSGAQQTPHFLPQFQKGDLLWQQQQLLQRQREVLQQQREKLMQQQASWEQQRQKTLLQSECLPQQKTKAKNSQQFSGCHEALGNFNGVQAKELSPPPSCSVNPRAALHRSCKVLDHEQSSAHVEGKRPEMQYSPRTERMKCNDPSSQGTPGLPEAPPPLKWEVSETTEASVGSSGSADFITTANKKLQFTAVGGSREQRLQLRCEVIGDPTVNSTKSATFKGTTTSEQNPLEAETDVQTDPAAEIGESLSCRQTEASGKSQTAVEYQGAGGAAEAEGECSSSDDGAPTVQHEGNAADAGKSASKEAATNTEDTTADLQVQKRFIWSPRLRRLPQDTFRIGPHDLIPVGPLIAAISSTCNGWNDENCITTDNCTEDPSYIEAYLPIKSLAEFESFDKGQEAQNVLDVRRDVVGCGTYGIVRKLRHRKGGFTVAVKSIEKETVVQAGMVNQVEFELYVQRDLLRHQNVLRCFSCVEDAEYLHIVLGYCEQGDLYRRIREQPHRRFSELDAFCFFAQLVNGLHCVHASGIIHRDLKLENLLLTKGNVLKIADFGWCGSIVGRDRSFSFCGTLDYLAPEMVKGQGHDWRVDLWSLGKVMASHRFSHEECALELSLAE